MIRITGTIDQVIMDGKVRLAKGNKKIDSVTPISKISSSFKNNGDHDKHNNSNNESEHFAKVLEKNKKNFDKKA